MNVCVGEITSPAVCGGLYHHLLLVTLHTIWPSWRPYSEPKCAKLARFVLCRAILCQTVQALFNLHSHGSTMPPISARYSHHFIVMINYKEFFLTYCAYNYLKGKKPVKIMDGSLYQQTCQKLIHSMEVLWQSEYSSSVCPSRLVCFQAAATLQCKWLHIYGQHDETTKVMNSRGQCFTTKL